MRIASIASGGSIGRCLCSQSAMIHDLVLPGRCLISGFGYNLFMGCGLSMLRRSDLSSVFVNILQHADCF
jgi:hypothetical protein